MDPGSSIPGCMSSVRYCTCGGQFGAKQRERGLTAGCMEQLRDSLGMKNNSHVIVWVRDYSCPTLNNGCMGSRDSKQ